MNGKPQEVSDRLSAYLNEFNAFPIQALLDEPEWWPPHSVEGMAATFCRADILYARDVMSRKHLKIYGPDVSDEYFISPVSNHLHANIIEIDFDSYELEAIIQIGELTAPYRCS